MTNKRNKPDDSKVSVPINKRDDPNYRQLSGYVPKELAVRFRIICKNRRITHGEGLEQVLEKWLARNSPDLDKKRN